MTGPAGNTDIDSVRAATDLVALIGEHVPLRQRGREHVGVCPFHDDHDPSLAVVTHKGDGFYKCHACGAAGDCFTFMMQYHRMPFGDALRNLAERAGITLRRQPGPGPGAERDDLGLIRQANGEAAAYFRGVLRHPQEGAAAGALFRKRGLGPETIEAWGLGAAPASWDGLVRHAATRKLPIESLLAAGLAKRRTEGPGCYDTFRNRLIFPIHDELGRPIAFGGRQIDPEDQPKYLNSPESRTFNKSRVLYGLHRARRAIIDSRTAIVTEGYTDVIACHTAGHLNVVATLGTALTPDHARVLRRLCETVVLVFDGDEAGQRAADRAVQIVFAEALDVRICVLPGGCDPADLLLGDPGPDDGPARFAAALAAATDALEYKVGRFREALRGAAGLAGRRRVVDDVIAELVRLGFDRMPGVHRAAVEGRIEQALGVRATDLEAALVRQRPAAASPRPAPAIGAPSEGKDPEARISDACPPGRRRAERELLAILVFDPSLSQHTVIAAEGDPPIPVARLVDPACMLDPGARAVSEVVIRVLAQGRDCTVAQIMAEMSEPTLRRLAAELEEEGRRRCEASEGAAAALHEAAAGLCRLVGVDRYREDLEAYRQGRSEGASVEALSRIVEQRRRLGYVPGANPSRLRT